MAASPSESSTSAVPATPKDPDPETYEPSAPPEELEKPLVDTFMPKLYTFKVSDQETSPERSASPSRFTRMPPFWTLLDHSLGVIWCLIADKHVRTLGETEDKHVRTLGETVDKHVRTLGEDKHVRTLGISDLQWTLQFLKGVRNKQGEYPKDVQALIDTIQDQLIEQYASMTKQTPDKQNDEESSDKMTIDLTKVLQSPQLDDSIYHDATDEALQVSTPIGKTVPFIFDTPEPTPISRTVYAKSTLGNETSVTYAELMEHRAASSSTSDQPKPTDSSPKSVLKTDTATAKEKGLTLTDYTMAQTCELRAKSWWNKARYASLLSFMILIVSFKSDSCRSHDLTFEYVNVDQRVCTNRRYDGYVGYRPTIQSQMEQPYQQYIAVRNIRDMFNVFMDHLSSEQLVDCTLSCQGQFLKAHKMVLSACSPYFQELFRQHQIPHPIIIMNGMKFIDIKLVVEFMYRGEIKVLEAELEGLLAAAETLQVKGLSHVRTKYEKGDIQGSSELQQQQQVTVDQPPASPSPDRNPGSGPTPLDTPIETEGRPTRNCTPLHLRRKRRKSPHNPMEDPLEETITTLGDRRSSSGNIQFTKVSVNDFVDNNDDDLPTTIKVEPPEIRDIDEENSGWGSHKLVIDMPQSSQKVSTGLSVVLQPGGGVSKTSLKQSSDVHSDGGSDFKMSTKRIMQPLLNKRGKGPGNVLVPQWHKKPAIAGKIPRPPNAFMIFANEWRRKLAYQYPDESNKDISCRLGIMWKNMSVGSKEGYYTASRAADVEHKRKYPGYYYSPMEARLRKHIKHGITAARRSGRIPRLPKVIPLSDPDFLCLSDLNGKAARWKSIRPGRPPGRKPKDLLRKMMKAESASPEPPPPADKRKMEDSQESPNSSNK
uniref:Uncharacterized protein n=1 Tax=Timema monikensis TaxID=170555 RepID=A0A7R9EDR9_9NEOP|nr:unnamed protein product [Timema monikensis]